MVSGTLALKNGYYYAVLSYQDAAGKRHQKWVSTGLPQKGNKRRAEQELIRIRSEFEIPPAAGELNSNILKQVGILPQTLVSDQFSNHPFFRFNHIVLYNADGQVLKFGTGRSCL